MKTDNIVRRYSEEMVQRWNMEIDTLLVYVSDMCYGVVPHTLIMN